MLKFFEKHFGLVVLLGLVAGLVIGQAVEITPFIGKMMEWYMIFGLALLVLLSALKIKYGELFNSIKKIYFVVLIVVAKLAVIPIFVFFLAHLFGDLIPDNYLIGLVFLSAAPVAMASPGLLLVLKGEISSSLLITLLCNFLAPFVLPLVLLYTVGTKVEFDVVSMIMLLSFVTFVPFLLSFGLKKFTPSVVKSVNRYSGGIVGIHMIVFLICAVAPYSVMILSDVRHSLDAFMFVLVLSILLHIFALLFSIKSKKSVVVSNIIHFAYFN